MDKISGLKAGNQQLKEVRFLLTMCSQNTYQNSADFSLQYYFLN